MAGGRRRRARRQRLDPCAGRNHRGGGHGGVRRAAQQRGALCLLRHPGQHRQRTVTLDTSTERATLSLRGDLTVTYDDGRSKVVRERAKGSGGRSYWGVSHALLIADFYAGLAQPGPFWIDAAEG